MTKSTGKVFRCLRHWPVAKRLAHYTAPPNEQGCALWTGMKNNNGYGILRLNGKSLTAHRLAWETENGPVTDNLNVLHRCDIRACVNVAHLLPWHQSGQYRRHDGKGAQPATER